MCQANFLAMTMMTPRFPCQQAWKLLLTALFVLDCCFWGHKGVLPCWRHPQIPWIDGTSTPNLDPFFLPLLLTIAFNQTTNQTFIVHMKSTPVLYKKGLCIFWFWVSP